MCGIILLVDNTTHLMEPFYCYIPAVYNSKKVPSNVWYYPRVRFRMPEYREHPSQKPEVLLRRIVLASSNVGDLILDPFSGTFTTSVVSMKLNRKSIGIELD